MARPRLPAWLMAGLLVLVTMTLYWPATRCDFVDYDDSLYVYQNVHVQSGLTWPGIRWAFSNLEAGFWHPLTWLSILADGQFYGLRAWGYHLTSVLLHAASTGLLFLALQRMTGATWRSAFVAGLFGWHPLHVESVAWVAERKDVLSGFFWMLTLLLYARYAEVRSLKSKVQSPKSVVSGPWSLSHLPSSLFYLLSLFFFALGLMSKPMVVTLPLVLLLLDWWPLQRLSFSAPRPRVKPMLSLVWEKVPFLVAALFFGVMTIYAVGEVGSLGPVTEYPLAGRFQNALLAYLGYLKQTLWPAGLAVFYPYPGTFPAGRTTGAGLVGLLLSALLLWAPRKRAYLAAGWLWYVVTLLPVIGLIQVGDFSRADRFTYVPLIGVFVAISWGGYELTWRWRYQVLGLSVAGGAALFLCLGLTRQQLGYWNDGETLFRHALAVTENNQIAHKALGDALDKEGQTDEAIRRYQEAIRLTPGYADARNNLGNVLLKKGQTDEAIRQFQAAIHLKPDFAKAYSNLGMAFEEKGQIDKAIRQYQEAIRLKPDFPKAHNNLGDVLLKKGQSEEAIRQFQEAIRLEPDYADAHYNHGNALAGKGRIDEAIRQYQEAIRLKADHADYHNNLGAAFYQQGRTGEAIRQFEEALRLKPDFAGARKNLDLVAKAHASQQPGASTNP
jgi:tetratricopeptide (TPR) repeat protein